MTRTLLCRLTIVMSVVVLLAALAPAAAAQGPTPSGTYALMFYNFISDEGGAACPSGAVTTGSDSALGTFHFWPENVSPYAGVVSISQYTVCWDGWITFPSSSNWFVQAIHDDGMDIWVDGNITLRAWYDTGPTTDNGTFSIDPTVAHHVIIKYYNDTLGGTACVGWGVQGSSLSYWNCPSAPTVAQAPVYTPPVYTPPVYTPPVYTPPVYTPPVYTPPVYTPPTTQPYYGNMPCGVSIGGQMYYQPVQPSSPLCIQGQQYVPPQQFYTRPALPAHYCVYVVRRGDTLSRIALRFGTNYWTLAYMNRIANPSLIFSGMSLVVPNCQ